MAYSFHSLTVVFATSYGEISDVHCTSVSRDYESRLSRMISPHKNGLPTPGGYFQSSIAAESVSAIFFSSRITSTGRCVSGKDWSHRTNGSQWPPSAEVHILPFPVNVTWQRVCGAVHRSQGTTLEPQNEDK